MFLFRKGYLHIIYLFFTCFCLLPYRYHALLLYNLNFLSPEGKEKKQKVQKLFNLSNSLGDKDNCTELDIIFFRQPTSTVTTQQVPPLS